MSQRPQEQNPPARLCTAQRTKGDAVMVGAGSPRGSSSPQQHRRASCAAAVKYGQGFAEGKRPGEPRRRVLPAGGQRVAADRTLLSAARQCQALQLHRDVSHRPRFSCHTAAFSLLPPRGHRLLAAKDTAAFQTALSSPNVIISFGVKQSLCIKSLKYTK